MTALIMPGRKVARLTGAAYRGHPIVVEVQAQLLTFRLKGKRTRYTLSIVGAFEHAGKIAAHVEAKERKARRAERAKLRKAGAL
ncbi:MAG: hypothetical protein RQ748_09895 [Elusimicrobiales bacterium]|nr:hypothetical protein [Elusimicrobiales bacterium]